MKVINKAENLTELEELLGSLVSPVNHLVSWQLCVDGKRKVYPVFLKSIENEVLKIESASQKDFELESSFVFFYSEDRQVIFKSNHQNFEGKQADILLPDEIKFLAEEEMANVKSMLDVFKDDLIMVEGEGRANEEHEDMVVHGTGEANINEETHMRYDAPDVTDKISTTEAHSTETEHIDTNRSDSTTTEHMSSMRSDSTSTDKIDTTWQVKSMSAKDAALFEEELSYVTLEDEDKMYEGMRAAPRSKPPEGKMVTVQVDDESRPQSTHPLYDLSQGGLAFLVFSKEEFNAGETLLVKAFDTKKFETPMQVEVKAIREADEMGIQYKVGCAFVHGEE